MSDLRIIKTSRQIIENKLITAISDSGCVAILASEEDLRIIISGLSLLEDTKAQEMAGDLRQLFASAFPQ